MFGERDVLVKREQYRDLVREAEQIRQPRAGRARPERVRFLARLTQWVRLRARRGAATLRIPARGVKLLLRRYTV